MPICFALEIATLMDKPKKEPALLNRGDETKLCLNCGFPNRNTDTNCMYCKTSLIDDSGLFSWIRQTYYILRWRWQLKQRREKVARDSRMSLLKAAGFFALGAGLSGIGLFVFMRAIDQNSFSSGLIAILFFSYGVVTLRALFFKK